MAPPAFAHRGDHLEQKNLLQSEAESRLHARVRVHVPLESQTELSAPVEHLFPRYWAELLAALVPLVQNFRLQRACEVPGKMWTDACPLRGESESKVDLASVAELRRRLR